MVFNTFALVLKHYLFNEQLLRRARARACVCVCVCVCHISYLAKRVRTLGGPCFPRKEGIFTTWSHSSVATTLLASQVRCFGLQLLLLLFLLDLFVDFVQRLGSIVRMARHPAILQKERGGGGIRIKERKKKNITLSQRE